ncbi:MAG: ABC transporter substrate-binding protein [Streptosporangiaceae bacterium]|jgi:NitT/TauT family transport system substrate-binding protein/taurine transport system substrate-binding protein
MSTEAQASTPTKRSVPLYKRRRRRLYGAAALALAIVIGVVVWATTGGSGSGPLPSFTISVSQGSVASPDSIIESQPTLAKLIPAELKYVPFEAGVTAIAEMKSGSVQAISGVGNPPLTEAIGDGTGVTVVMGWGFDDDQLLVPASITSPAQLAGKSVGVLVGSSEDYELLGYLSLEHLTGKVKVVPFSDENAAGAAALSGAVDAAYVYGSPATQLLAKGDHSLVNAQQIAKLGVPGLDVIAVASSLIKTNPTLVQDYVCAELQGSRDMTGPQAAKYLTASSAVQGVPGDQIVAATKGYPFIAPSDQLFWLGSTQHDPNSRIVQAYVQTGQFLVSQGRLTSAPSAAQIAQHIDITFIKKALAGACPS